MLLRRSGRLVSALAVTAGVLVVTVIPAAADQTPATVYPFEQNWNSTAGLITAAGNWSSIPSIIGYRGDNMGVTNTDPRSILADGSSTPVDLIPNSTTGSTTGGIHEIEAAGTIALQGSGTADAPHIVIRLDTTGREDVSVSYLLRDLDADDSATAGQQVALHYRVGGTGSYTDVAAAYVADAAGPGTAMPSIPVSVTLPAAVDNQSIVDVRIMTTDTTGADSMTGVDDIVVNSVAITGPAQPIAACPATLVTDEGTAASAPVSASDADSNVVSMNITSSPVPGISLSTNSGDSADLLVADSTAVGVYDVVIEFATDDSPAQTTTCTVEVTVEAVTPVLKISEVQGTGATNAKNGQAVAVEGILTARFTSNDALSGFWMQEEVADYDADANTSEGIFVYCGNVCGSLAVGDLVRVEGTATESFLTTQIGINPGSPASVTLLTSGNDLPPGQPVDLPAATRDSTTFEHLEGMVVTFTDTLHISEYFRIPQFGEVLLAAGDRPFQFTHDNAPSAAGNAAYIAALNMRRITLDDETDDQNDATSGPSNNEPYPYPSGGLSLTNRFRGGDTIEDLTGVFQWAFSQWRVRPIQTESYTFTPVNVAPVAPDPVGGTLRVSAFNVLNYFTTIDTTSSNNTGPCGPSGTLDCRGADSVAELVRQRDKLMEAVLAMDPDIAGLIELQNDAGASIQDIVDELNARGTRTYSYVDTGFIGSDAIKVGFIYDTETVALVGDYEILDESDDPRFITTRSRPALIQTFQQISTGEVMTIAVNHFKSKGSACTTSNGPDNDPDLGDGQGNCPTTRTRAAQALVDFLATDPTGSGDPDFLIMGDLNAYRMEDPITAIKGAGYIDLIEEFLGDHAYSFLFDGQLGYLDHALASPSLASQVTGATEWHINADESPLFDYNDTIADAGEATFERESTALPLYAPTAIRSSDHDPIVIGFVLGTLVSGGDPPDVSGDEGTKLTNSGSFTGTPPITIVQESGPGTLTDNGDGTWSWSYDAPDEETSTVVVRATNGVGQELKQEFDVTVDNVPPVITSVTNDGPVDEGQPATITVNATDVPADALSYWFDCGNDGLYEIGPQASNSATCTFEDQGTYTVPVEVQDDSGAIDTDSTTVTVDNADPTITDVSNDGPVDEGSSATITVDASDVPADTLMYSFDCDGDLTYEVGPQASPSTTCAYSDGPATVTVNVLVEDEDGGSATGSTDVVVLNVPPVVTLDGPTEIDEGQVGTFTWTTDDVGSPEEFSVTLADCGLNGTPVGGFDLPDGSGELECLFPLGARSSDVTVCVEDGDGGGGCGQVTVSIRSTMQKKIDVRDTLAALPPHASKQTRDRVAEAIRHLDRSLAANLWVDESHLDPKKGDTGVFNNEKQAIQALMQIKSPSAAILAAIEDLCEADRQLAVTAINEATGPGSAQRIANANRELAKGDAQVAKGRCDNAVDHYRNAWKHAQKA